MEEEYRLHKTHASVDLNAMTHHDASSTTGMKSPPDRPDTSRTTSDIPTIRISTESARTPNGDGQSKFPDSDGPEVDEPQDLDQADQEAGNGESAASTEPVLEKPQTAHEKEDGSGAAGVISGEGDEAVSAFSNKRLCERWLGRYSGILRF